MNNALKSTVALAGIFGIVAIIAVGSMISGFVLQTLWGWFIAPKFAVSALGLAEAIGLSMVVTFLTHSAPTDSERQTSGEKTQVVINAFILKPVLYLLIGLIVSSFI